MSGVSIASSVILIAITIMMIIAISSTGSQGWYWGPIFGICQRQPNFRCTPLGFAMVGLGFYQFFNLVGVVGLICSFFSSISKRTTSLLATVASAGGIACGLAISAGWWIGTQEAVMPWFLTLASTALSIVYLVLARIQAYQTSFPVQTYHQLPSYDASIQDAQSKEPLLI